MNRPSGETKGEYIPSEPGTIDVRAVRRTTEAIRGWGSQFSPEKIKELPSGNQLEGNSSRSPCETTSGLPPSAETTEMFQIPPGGNAANAIRVPSGDHLGPPATRGGLVNCMRSLPSNLLRQRMLSGNVT